MRARQSASKAGRSRRCRRCSSSRCGGAGPTCGSLGGARGVGRHVGAARKSYPTERRPSPRAASLQSTSRRGSLHRDRRAPQPPTASPPGFRWRGSLWTSRLRATFRVVRRSLGRATHDPPRLRSWVAAAARGRVAAAAIALLCPRGTFSHVVVYTRQTSALRACATYGVPSSWVLLSQALSDPAGRTQWSGTSVAAAPAASETKGGARSPPPSPTPSGTSVAAAPAAHETRGGARSPPASPIPSGTSVAAAPAAHETRGGARSPPPSPTPSGTSVAAAPAASRDNVSFSCPDHGFGIGRWS